jgi:hypothetical protein
MSKSLPRLAALAVAFLPTTAVQAAHDHDSHLFSAFLSAEADFASTKPGDNDSKLDAVADVIFSHHAGRWRLLGEFVLSPDEHELERAQLGYEVSDNTVVWVGRFHQPSSVWNVFFHHGQFLQTSITRPAMEQWEDEDGFLPHHIVGSTIESFIPTDGADAWRITVSAGLSPRVDESILKPYMPFRGNKANLSHTSLRAEWLPDALGEDVVGIVASRTRMRRDGPLAPSPVTVRMVGVFANLGTSRLRAVGDLMLLDTQGSAAASLRFRQHLSGYVQLEAEPRPGATLFARQEVLTNVRDSAYFALLNPPPVRRTVAGARAQIGLRNALSVELSRGRLPSGMTLREVRLQWSAAYP